jgi:hypothetical protein
MSIMTFSLSRTAVEVSHAAAGELMVPGPFHSVLLGALFEKKCNERCLINNLRKTYGFILIETSTKIVVK